MVFAMSRSVRVSMVRVMWLRVWGGGSVAERPEHVSGDQEALLYLLVRALEPAILVLDDAVALVTLAIELPVDDPPVDLAEPRDARDLPAHAEAEDTALVEPVAVDHEVFRLIVQDVGSE